MAKELDRILVIPDCHRPYHDKRAWDVMIKAAKHFRPRTLIVLGDFQDCFSISAHDKNPNRVKQFDEEVKDAREGLEELESLGAENKYFDCGNHEDRLSRYLMQKAPELYNMVSTPAVLELKKHGWKYQEYGQYGNVGKLYHTHDVGFAGKHAVLHTGAAFQRSVVFGHTHRLAVNYFGSVDGKRHFAASLGWLGDIKEANYMPAAKKAEWQLGFGFVRVEPNNNIHLQLVPIVDYRCVLEGKLI